MNFITGGSITGSSSGISYTGGMYFFLLGWFGSGSSTIGGFSYFYGGSLLPNSAGGSFGGWTGSSNF